jgi:4-hydroxy-tetrahydrodipicolinate synthase
MARFGRVMTAMITPFDDRGALDLDGVAKLSSWLVEQGNDGLVVAGTTGESPTLTHDEQIDLVRVVCETVDVPVLAGAGSNDTRAAIELTERVAEVGAAGVLSVVPYYNRPPQAGLLAHFKAIAQSTELPVMLYDVPVRTGRKIETSTILELAREVPNIVALKDAGGSPAETSALIAAAPAGFEVYSGDDVLTLPLLAVGAVGTIGVATHWIAREVGAMIEAFEKGDVARARAINASLISSYAFETGDLNPNPMPTKAMMKVLGQPGGDCRPPLGPEPEGLQDRARRVLAELGK